MLNLELNESIIDDDNYVVVARGLYNLLKFVGGRRIN